MLQTAWVQIPYLKKLFEEKDSSLSVIGEGGRILIVQQCRTVKIEILNYEHRTAQNSGDFFSIKHHNERVKNYQSQIIFPKAEKSWI